MKSFISTLVVGTALTAIISATTLLPGVQPNAVAVSEQISNEETEYQQAKAAKIGVTAEPYVPLTLEQLNGNNSIDASVSTSGLLIPLDGSFSVCPFTNGAPPEYRNDDGSTVALSLPFSFCFYGTQYNTIFINNNGNLSFTGPYSEYTPSGFPIGGYGMIAAFWADVDTRNPSSGIVYYRSEPHRFTVIWNRVGYYNYWADKVNTFEVIITDGTDPVVGAGYNVAFSYTDMQWTTGDASGGTGGFGGSPATVGANKGDGINYAIIGRFDHEGMDYDGPGGVADGVSYLDNKLFRFNTCQGLGSIAGTVFNDMDADGVKDPGDYGLPGWTVILDPGELLTTTDVNGNYFFSFLQPNTYTVREVVLRNWLQVWPVLPGTYQIQLAQGQTVSGKNFGNLAIGCQDLHIDLSGDRARINSDRKMEINYRNVGTVTVGGVVVTMQLPSKFVFVECSSGGTYVSTNHTVVWNLGSLESYAEGRLGATVYVPDLVIGTHVITSATIAPTSGDVRPEDNIAFDYQIVRGGLDPNEKKVYPDEYSIKTDTLNYHIDFQNVGNDTAYSIIIRDSLDTDLDPATILVGVSSHPGTFNLVGRELVWTFRDIYLPDSIIDEPGSHGFVNFKAVPKTTTAIGTIITNRAWIYFDENLPVLTNTVQTQITDFRCGDANGDYTVNVADAVFLINYVFKGGAEPEPPAAGDANCDNDANVADAVYIINYVFKSGPFPCFTCP